jgi:ribosomal protein L33
VRLTITLECTEQKESGVAGMSRYMTQKVRARVVHRVASRVARISRRRVAFRTRGKPYALEGFGSLSVVRGGKGGTSRAEARRRFLPPRARRRRPRPPPSVSRPLPPSTPSTDR